MKNNNKTTATATAIFESAQPENVVTKNEKKKGKVQLSTVIALQDKASDRAEKKALFADMLGELRGINGNCKLFQQFKDDNRMKKAVRLANIGVNSADYGLIFSAEFITENIHNSGKVYKLDALGKIVKRTATSNEKTIAKYTELGYKTEIDEKSGKTIYLVPMSAYTFDQFLGLVREAVRNYFLDKIEEQRSK